MKIKSLQLKELKAFFTHDDGCFCFVISFKNSSMLLFPVLNLLI